MHGQAGAFLLALALAFGTGAALSQTKRGSPPPGTSRDGAGPSDGAITGGSIRPGEAGGIPQSAPQPAARPESTSPELREQRCVELSGSLREQCLLQERGASTGGTRRDPRIEPPPQNPNPR